MFLKASSRGLVPCKLGWVHSTLECCVDQVPLLRQTTCVADRKRYRRGHSFRLVVGGCLYGGISTPTVSTVRSLCQLMHAKHMSCVRQSVFAVSTAQLLLSPCVPLYLLGAGLLPTPRRPPSCSTHPCFVEPRSLLEAAVLLPFYEGTAGFQGSAVCPSACRFARVQCTGRYLRTCMRNPWIRNPVHAPGPYKWHGCTVWASAVCLGVRSGSELALNPFWYVATCGSGISLLLRSCVYFEASESGRAALRSCSSVVPLCRCGSINYTTREINKFVCDDLPAYFCVEV